MAWKVAWSRSTIVLAVGVGRAHIQHCEQLQGGPAVVAAKKRGREGNCNGRGSAGGGTGSNGLKAYAVCRRKARPQPNLCNAFYPGAVAAIAHGLRRNVELCVWSMHRNPSSGAARDVGVGDRDWGGVAGGKGAATVDDGREVLAAGGSERQTRCVAQSMRPHQRFKRPLFPLPSISLAHSQRHFKQSFLAHPLLSSPCPSHVC